VHNKSFANRVFHVNLVFLSNLVNLFN